MINAIIFGNYDDEVLSLAEELKKNFKLYIFTSTNIDENITLLNKLGVVFDEIISSVEFDATKNSPLAYFELLERISYKPDEALYVDTLEETVYAAKAAGLKAIEYKSDSELQKELHDILGVTF